MILTEASMLKYLIRLTYEVDGVVEKT